MAKTKISEYSTTNSSNTDIEGINIAEGCAPSGINNAIREVMVHLKEFQTGASSDPLTVAGTFVASGSASLSGAATTISNARILSCTGSTWDGGTITVPYGGTGATTLTGVVIGSGTSAFTAKTNPSGAFVGTTDTQTLTNKTLTDPAIIGTILEDVFTITDGAAFEIDPGNGSIQLVTLGANRTPKATNFAAGEAVTLMVLDGTAYSITWTDATFGGSGVVWVGGSAPTLDTTKYTVIELWKVGTQVYGALVGFA